jgi:hypothetical protein
MKYYLLKEVRGKYLKNLGMWKYVNENPTNALTFYVMHQQV